MVWVAHYLGIRVEPRIIVFLAFRNTYYGIFQQLGSMNPVSPATRRYHYLTSS